MSLQLSTSFEEITCSQGEKHLQGAIIGIHTGLEIVHIPNSQMEKLSSALGIQLSTQKGIASLSGQISPKLKAALLLPVQV